MDAETAQFKPLKPAHARWLRDVYNNMSRFRGDGTLSVVKSPNGVRIVGEQDANTGQLEEVTRNNGGLLLSKSALNQMVRNYNAARQMFGGNGVNVIFSEGEIVVSEDGENSGSAFPQLYETDADDVSVTIFNRHYRHHLVKMALAWTRMRGRRPIEVIKSDWNYIVRHTEGGTQGFDWELIFTDAFEEETLEQHADDLTYWDVSAVNVGDTIDLGGGFTLGPYPAGVDVIGQNSIGTTFFDLLPGNGMYIDLAGTYLGEYFPNDGILTSKTAFSFVNGEDYRLAISLAGNQRESDNASEYVTTVELGNWVDASINPGWDDDFTTYQYEFTATSTVNANIIISQQQPSPYNKVKFYGNILGSVTLEKKVTTNG